MMLCSHVCGYYGTQTCLPDTYNIMCCHNQEECGNIRSHAVMKCFVACVVTPGFTSEKKKKDGHYLSITRQSYET
jgi:hypothetical protein